MSKIEKRIKALENIIKDNSIIEEVEEPIEKAVDKPKKAIKVNKEKTSEWILEHEDFVTMVKILCYLLPVFPLFALMIGFTIKYDILLYVGIVGYFLLYAFSFKRLNAIIKGWF